MFAKLKGKNYTVDEAKEAGYSKEMIDYYNKHSINKINKMDLSQHTNKELERALVLRARIGDESSLEFKQILDEIRRRKK